MCFVVTCWERADLLALVCGVFCEFVTFPYVSWVRCGTWLYRFLIFATLLTLKAASIMGKQVSFQWKKAGRHGQQHPLSIHCRVAKKHLRSTQRRQQAAYWPTVSQDIMAADSSNKKLFSPLSIDNAKRDGMHLASSLLMTDISKRMKPLERVGHFILRDWPLQWMITHTMKVLNNKLIWTLISSVTYVQVSRIVYQKFLVKQLRGLSSHWRTTDLVTEMGYLLNTWSMVVSQWVSLQLKC